MYPVIFPLIRIEARHFGSANSKYPNLNGLVNWQSLKRLGDRSRYYEKRKMSARAEKPAARVPVPDF
jgi:hypothetical protein